MMKSLRSSGRSTAARTCAQVVEAALEIRPVGQHAEAGRPVPLVDLGDFDGLEVLAEDAARGAGLLHLGDQADGRAAGQCGEKIARRRGGGQLPAQLVRRDARLGGRHFTPLLGNDLVEEWTS